MVGKAESFSNPWERAHRPLVVGRAQKKRLGPKAVSLVHALILVLKVTCDLGKVSVSKA